MVEKIEADASPEKRLFISLITRDITLAEAILDIIDNSINAALEPHASELKTADDYQRLSTSRARRPGVEINLTISSSRISVQDNASGISTEMAKDHVFKFGRDAGDTTSTDRLSVYGIGLKRAMFKCGNKVSIVSDHKDGGFELKLDVQRWAKLKQEPWSFEITPRAPQKREVGTRVVITELYDDVLRRLNDGLFQEQLRDRISRTYALFLGRIVDIKLNGKSVVGEEFNISKNHASKKFNEGKVSCSITAGIAANAGDLFRDRNAGWFVFCNGRAVLFADKSSTTGWAGAGLPIFQPKHRPFLGTVFFVSEDPEALPWTTTKAAVNEESAVWQTAKRHMVTVGHVVIGFLDRRYTDDGTEVSSSELLSASGGAVSVFSAAAARPREFKAPTKPAPLTVKVQYSAKVADVRKIGSYLRKPSMGASAVGLHTFNHFLKNEVGDDS